MRIIIFIFLVIFTSNSLFADVVKEYGMCELKYNNKSKKINVIAEVDTKTRQALRIIMELDKDKSITLDTTKEKYVFGKSEGETYLVFNIIKQVLQRIDLKTKKVLESYDVTQCVDK